LKATTTDQRALALCAAACAEHVLPFFEEVHPTDHRPRTAIEAGRAWVRGEVTVADARAAAFAAHSAARDVPEGAARAAARSAGHAAATAHVASHSAHAATYAVSAATLAAGSAETIEAKDAGAKERLWQITQLPESALYA
jgi:hypothetical protein